MSLDMYCIGSWSYHAPYGQYWFSDRDMNTSSEHKQIWKISGFRIVKTYDVTDSYRSCSYKCASTNEFKTGRIDFYFLMLLTSYTSVWKCLRSTLPVSNVGCNHVINTQGLNPIRHATSEVCRFNAVLDSANMLCRQWREVTQSSSHYDQ